ncbi:magnesium ion transporter [Agyrium rufum]|nr:magnesium ion transporter [Agyrium rufum]
MSICIAPRAPSSLLLHYLRTQVESTCFFTPNAIYPSDGYANTTALSSPPAKSCSARTFALSTRRRATVIETSLLNLDFIFAKKVKAKHDTNSQRLLNTPAGSTPSTRSSDSIIVPIHSAQIRRPEPSSRWSTPPLLQRHEQRRLASSDSQSLFKKILHMKEKSDVDKGIPEHGDAHHDFPGFLSETGHASVGRTTAKAPNELKLRCTEFDENGNVVIVNGEFKKQELIAKYGLLPRDLRKIDSSTLPHILIRPSAILMNLLHLRVLIKHDRVLVFDVYGSTDSYTQSLFMYDLEGRLRQKDTPRQVGGLPYEFRALEAVLISVTSGLEGEFEGVREPVVRVLRELEGDIDRDKLRHLLIYSKKLGTFEQKARLVRDAINDLLEQDEDLAQMYLSERAQGIIREEEGDHNEVEMLLESYHKVCDEIVQVSGNLVSNIRNTEEIVKAILDANRNSLMLLDLKFSIGTLGIGSGAFIAALYGMNLKNYMEESSFGFVTVCGLSFVFASIICSYGLVKLRKVQRVSMWGEEGSAGGRGRWGDIDPMPALPGETRKERLLRIQAARQEAWRQEKINAVESGWERRGRLG